MNDIIKNRFRLRLISLLMGSILTVFMGCGKHDANSNNSESTPYGIDSNYSTLSSFNKNAAAAISTSTASDISQNQINRFNQSAIDLFINNSSSENSVIDAFGFFQLMGIILAGAEDDTRDSLSTAFSFTSMETELSPVAENISLQNFYYSNHVWGQKSYRYLTSYLENLVYNHGAELHISNFHDDPYLAESSINELISEVSSEKISSPLALYNIDATTRLTAAAISTLELDLNTLFNMTEQFDGLFETENGQQYRVPHLRFSGIWGFYESDDLTAVDLSSDESSVSILVIRPKSNIVDWMHGSLADTLDEIANALQPTELDYALPEFSITTAHDLSGRFGLAEDSDDFSGVNGLGYLYNNGLSLETTIALTGSTLSAAGVSVAVTAATESEPDVVWGFYDFYNDNTYEFNDLVIGVSDIIVCSEEYIKAGDADSSPFLFIIRDKTSGIILSISKLEDAGGENAGTWECID